MRTLLRSAERLDADRWAAVLASVVEHCAPRWAGCTGRGTETTTEWNGSMDGAARSGERVAAEVLVEPCARH